MADNAAPEAQAEPEAEDNATQPQPERPQRTDWKAECRKWEERAKRSEQTLRELRAANDRAAEVAAVASEAGVPADVLSRMEGDPRENASILAKAGIGQRGYRPTRDAGEPPAAKADPMREAARALFGGRNQ